MELFYVENTKYIVKCPECSEIIEFKINFENFTISVECKNGHNKDALSFEYFEEQYIKPSHIYRSNCYNCYKELKDENDNSKCKICNKLFCQKCIKLHTQDTKHNSTIKFIQQYQLCQKHNQKYSFYCENCKSNICEKCKKTHKKHTIKSFLEIIPSQIKKDSVNSNIKEFETKINKVSNLIMNYKQEIDLRYRKIEDFLQFLKNINKCLLNNFNYNYFDYYNFKNFDYLLNSFKSDYIYDFERYKNYLYTKEEKTENIIEEKTEENNVLKTIKELNNNKRKYRKENETNINYIQNLNKLEYLKDNIFYVFDKSFIKFFEFKNYSFNPILSYDLGRFRINNIYPAKYSNSILINFDFKKNIKILEYDFVAKTITLSKKEIKEQKFGYPRHFYNCIDDINGNIIVQDNIGTSIWKIGDKKNYIKHSTINISALSLFNINETLFCFQDMNYNIYFYDCINYDCNKKIEYHKKINFVGTINNEVIIFNYSYGNILLLVDIKFLEIVQIIDNNKYYSNIKIKDNNLLMFIMEKDYKLKIIKKTFDIKEKNFNKTEIMEKESILNSFSNVLITDSEYVVILNYNYMIILKI